MEKGTHVRMGMGITDANTAYLAWLGKRIPTIQKDLDDKHAEMAKKPFAFLRATFFRWAQVWPEFCPELTSAPQVLGIGDLHIENFGTWRDLEGRLIWGMNDFDEAAVLPYCNDLVRLALSAELRKRKIPCSRAQICQSILDGYRESLETGGGPFVVGREHVWLRTLARKKKNGDPVQYWKDLEDQDDITRKTPPEVLALLESALPKNSTTTKIIHRQAGLGSLGRRRFTALALWREANVAREAKELTVSAWRWYLQDPTTEIHYRTAVEKAVRVPDPFLKLHKHWVIRRLAPDCSKLELGPSLDRNTARQLLHAMGWETANIHLGTKNAKTAILKDLRKRPRKWLNDAVQRMASSVQKDWKTWRAYHDSKGPRRKESK